MKVRNFGLIATVLLTMVPVSAQAQLDIKETATKIIQKVGVRVNLGFRDPIDPDVSKGRSFGVSVGLSPGRTPGWRFPIGLTRFNEHLHSPSGEQFALLRSTAIIAGIGYSWHVGRMITGVSLDGGYAFNSGRTEGDLQQAFHVPGDVSLEVDNSLLLRPHAKAEYFFTPKVSIRATADYVMTKPGITVTTTAGQIADRWDASNMHAAVGVSFYPFRK